MKVILTFEQAEKIITDLHEAFFKKTFFKSLKELAEDEPDSFQYEESQGFVIFNIKDKESDEKFTFRKNFSDSPIIKLRNFYQKTLQLKKSLAFNSKGSSFDSIPLELELSDYSSIVTTFKQFEKLELIFKLKKIDLDEF